MAESNTKPDIQRRRWLKRVLAAAGGAGLSSAIQQVLALAPGPVRQGVNRIRGDVRINGKPAAIGTLVRPGDVVTTGANGYVVLVVNEDAFLVRDNSRVEFRGDGHLVTFLRVVTGKLLSVFAPNRAKRTFKTSIATVGIRGTGLYIESEQDRVYVCTCYGTADLTPDDDPEAGQTVTTTHHEAPRYIYSPMAAKNGVRVAKAPVINHTDVELFMLEGLVHREPPFETAEY